jgi:hypothetical protein
MHRYLSRAGISKDTGETGVARVHRAHPEPHRPARLTGVDHRGRQGGGGQLFPRQVAVESQLVAGLAEKQQVVEALTLLSEAFDQAHVDIPR